MYQKEERVGVIVYLYYNRDVKKVRACHIQELDKNFVGSLHRQEENVII